MRSPSEIVRTFNDINTVSAVAILEAVIDLCKSQKITFPNMKGKASNAAFLMVERWCEDEIAKIKSYQIVV